MIYDNAKQMQEIETIREREFKLKLSEADVERIFKCAGAVGLTPERLLENFIGDLVGGTYSNGSDEERLAEEWFERCDFSWDRNKSFLSYLCIMADPVTIVCNYKEAIHLRELEALDEYDVPLEEAERLAEIEAQELMEEIEDVYSEYCLENTRAKPLDEEMKAVVEWYDKYCSCRDS